MKTYEIETDDGKKFEIDVDDEAPKGESKSPLGNISMPQRALTASMAGLPAAVGGIPPKRVPENFPLIGQLLGSPLGMPGRIGGAAAGEALNQAFRPALGGDPASLPEFAGSVGTTAGLEMLTGGLGKTVFRREIGINTLNKLGIKLGTIKKAVSALGEKDASLAVPKKEIGEFLDKTFSEIKVPFGPGTSILRKWQKLINNDQVKFLTPKTLIELEDDLSSIGKYSSQKIGGISIMPQVQKKAINSAIKELRTIVSKNVDDIAVKAGFDEFPELSKKISKLKYEFPNRELTRTNLFDALPRYALAGGAGALANLGLGPIGGIAAFLGTEAIQDPGLRGVLYKGLVKKGIGPAATVAASEGARRVSRQLTGKKGKSK